MVTFTGVYLLNLSRGDPNGFKLVAGRGGNDAIGTDMISTIQSRRSMEARRSLGRLSVGSSHRGDREGLIRAYDEEEAGGFGLTDLVSESDDERTPSRPAQNGTPVTNGHPKPTEVPMPKSGER